MGFNISSGNIQPGVLYKVIGVQSITYNSNTYTTGQTFLGIDGVFDYTLSGGLGSAEVDEVTQFFGSEVTFKTNLVDRPASYADTTLIKGMAIEFELNNEEKIVLDKTQIKGFSIELENYPFYAFEIIETRLY